MESYLTPQGVNTTAQDFSHVRTEGYRASPTRYIGDAFGLFGQQAGAYIGYIFVLFFIGLGISLLGIIPLIGQAIGIGYNLIQGALIAGFFIFAHNQIEHQQAKFNSFFGAFDRIGPFIVFQLIVLLIFIVLAAVIVTPFFFTGLIEEFIGFINTSQTNPEEALYQMQSIFGSMFMMYALIGIPILVLYTLWFMAPMFIAFNGLGAWEAMEASRKIVSKRFLSFLALFILLFLLNIGGAILLFVGTLVTFPVTQIALYLAYRDVCFQNDPEYASGGGNMRFGSHDPEKPLDFEL